MSPSRVHLSSVELVASMMSSYIQDQYSTTALVGKHLARDDRHVDRSISDQLTTGGSSSRTSVGRGRGRGSLWLPVQTPNESSLHTEKRAECEVTTVKSFSRRLGLLAKPRENNQSGSSFSVAENTEMKRGFVLRQGHSNESGTREELINYAYAKPWTDEQVRSMNVTSASEGEQRFSCRIFLDLANESDEDLLWKMSNVRSSRASRRAIAVWPMSRRAEEWRKNCICCCLTYCKCSKFQSTTNIRF